MNAFKVKCKCQHCDQTLEFDSDRAGEMVACPKCSLETRLFIPPTVPRPELKTAPPVLASNPQLSRTSSYGSIIQILALITFLGGLFLTYAGISEEGKEASRYESSAIRQTVYCIWYCTGFILMALGALIFSVGVIIKRNEFRAP